MHKYLIGLAPFFLFGVWAQRAPAQTPSFTGSFEVTDCNTISGWALDANNQNTSVRVNGSRRLCRLCQSVEERICEDRAYATANYAHQSKTELRV